ncbi:hypothetical protein DM02DRAFT_652432 [Periconia macrospinosa]|uniref:Uncharacterized protein n=1 Tax=Periconia macrospinosa TaxID=97972 RepID=A0A2V1DZS4_9PLEO|nr:hypothetical protein DM02DRAFT_652432 [Periconia macrospinosa]
MPDTTIFFLRHLEMFKVIMEESGPLETRTTITKSHSSHGKIRLVRTIEHSRVEHKKFTEESIYVVFDHGLVDMPKDERGKEKVLAKVELAFQLDTSDQPKMSALGEHVFAYLPLQRIPQFQFLVQSNFIASASRDATYRRAIEEILLPYQNTYKGTTRPSDLGETKIQDSERIARVESFVSLPWTTSFRDLDGEVYLAPEYGTRHHELLQDLGVKLFSISDAIERVSCDLVTVDSYIRTYPTSDDWHEKCANTLLGMLKISNEVNIRPIKQFGIVLVGGGWTGAAGFSPGGLSEIDFPRTDNVGIPEDIGLNLVESTAASNAFRRKLFQTLGVKYCPRDTVLARIEATQRNHPSNPLEWHSHLKYLSHYHAELESLAEWMFVPCIDYAWPANSIHPFYLPGDGEFDTK